MGLTSSSTGFSVVGGKNSERGTYVVALAGNPNVGKSTVFNALTGMNQHTGNWPGKTVGNARGKYTYLGTEYSLVDVPGTYSLLANSAEEEVARDFLCFGDCDCRIITVDATCLERNLNLVLQLLEFTDRAVVLLNLMDEAKKKGIRIDADELSLQLGVPVVPAAARSGKGLEDLKEAVRAVCEGKKCYVPCLLYGKKTEDTVRELSEIVSEKNTNGIPARWICLKLLERNSTLNTRIYEYTGTDFSADEHVRSILEKFDADSFLDEEVGTVVARAAQISSLCLFSPPDADKRDRRADRILTSPLTGIPVMLLLLAVVFWITIVGANYPSDFLSGIFSFCGEKLRDFLESVSCPAPIVGCVVDGIYLTLAWVVSVMLPPMAIFFPMFTLLEDVGYLPRVAFNLDGFFRRAGAHGKQSLTMCMGFGCNACGITGCRIIDSPRERSIALLTNNLVPCNGRFPTLIALISIFLAGSSVGGTNSLLCALILLAIIVISVAATLGASKFLSATFLKGKASAFTLELPPYRVPKVGSVIVRSIFDRTLFVLGRAVVVAVPAGLLIWLLANVTVADTTLLSMLTAFLDPFGRILGLDGAIVLGLILGFPANEIVLPIILMCYMKGGALVQYESLDALRELLVSNGWTMCTVLCMIAAFLFRFPCATSCLTVYKETKSPKMTAAAFALPTVMGIIACILIKTLFVMLG